MLTPARLPALVPLVASGAYLGMPVKGKDASAGVESGELDIGIEVWPTGIEATFGPRGGPLPEGQRTD